jgi:uncharacterized protein YecT (DUF1311 family)
MRATLTALVVVLALAGPALAEGEELLSQSELNAQAHKHWQEADAALNAAYKRLVPKLTRLQKVKLTAAQLAWIPFRDRECEFAADTMRGGSMAPLLRFGEMMRVTEARTRDFARVGTQPPLVGDKSKYRAADLGLNEAYQALMARPDGEGKKLLTRAELAWLAFRDAEVAFEQSWRAGAPEAVRWDCLTRLTRERREALRQHLEDYAG